MTLGLDHVVVRSDLGHPLPDSLAGYAGLVIMGGPQSARELHLYPYLEDEMTLLQQALVSRLPILGICLGAQLLARALGSELHLGKAPEIGWHEVTVNKEVSSDPVLRCLPPRITPLHWHGDRFDLPAGSTPVGSSDLEPVQGFGWQQRAYGLLFHLEVDLSQIIKMSLAFPDEMRAAGVDQDDLLAHAPERLRVLRSVGSEFFRLWAGLA